jgi:L-asparaginase/Glu-tRNA(Gln) amidotransferase subunit D
VIFAGSLTGPKARILLMLALGITADPVALKHLIEEGQYF